MFEEIISISLLCISMVLIGLVLGFVLLKLQGQ